MESIKEFISNELTKLSPKGRLIVATHDSREYLEDFAKSNGGSSDFILMQMAIQYGYKMALENVEEQL